MFSFSLKMKTCLISMVIFYLIGSTIADEKNTLSHVGQGAASQVEKGPTELLHKYLYPMLRGIPNFKEVFPPTMDVDEAAQTSRKSIQFMYKSLGVPLDENLLQGWIANFQRFADNGFSSENYVRCLSAMFADFLTNEHQLTPETAPQFAKRYVDILLKNLSLDEDEVMKGFDAVSPKLAAVVKANVTFLKSVNPNISKPEMDSLMKAFYEVVQVNGD